MGADTARLRSLLYIKLTAGAVSARLNYKGTNLVPKPTLLRPSATASKATSKKPVCSNFLSHRMMSRSHLWQERLGRLRARRTEPFTEFLR